MVVGRLWVVLRRQQLFEGALLLGVGLESKNHTLHAVVRSYRPDLELSPRQGMAVARKSDSALVINQTDAVSRTGGKQTLRSYLARRTETEHKPD